MNDDMNDMVAQDAAASGPTGDVDALLSQFIEQDSTVKALEENLKSAKEARARLQIELIPAAMQAARKKTIKYADGAVLSLRAFIEASLPSINQVSEAEEDKKDELTQRRLAGLAWLRENQGAPIIHNELVIEIPKGKDNLVAEVQALCDSLGLVHQRGENVHHMTLKSFLKEKIKAGLTVPVDIFKLVTGNKAHYKPGKAE